MHEMTMIVPAEMATAFRLAGIEVLACRTADEAWEHVQDVHARDDSRVVILAEHFVSGMAPQEYRALLQSDRPLCIPIPLDWQSTRDARSDFETHLGRILGCRVSLTSQLSGRRKATSP